MKLTTEQIKEMFKLLSGANATKLDDAERIKLVKIRGALRPIATAYNDFDKDATETLKFENFDELNAKAMSNALQGEELLEWNLGGVKYMKSLNAARAQKLSEEHDIELPTISQAVYLKLEKDNGWNMCAIDILEPIIE